MPSCRFHVSTSLTVMKRTAAPFASSKGPEDPAKTAKLGNEIGNCGSRFCSCPVCGRAVPKALINPHLDTCLLAHPSGQYQEQRTNNDKKHDDLIASPSPSAPKAAITHCHPPAVMPILRQHTSPAFFVPALVGSAAGAGSGARATQATPVVALALQRQLRTQAKPQKQLLLQPQPGGAAVPSASGTCSTRLRPAATGRGEQVATAHMPDAQGKLTVKRVLTARQLFVAAYCEFMPDFLPAELADQVLLDLMQDRPRFEHKRWWLGGREQQAPQSSCHYRLRDEGNDGSSTSATNGEPSPPPPLPSLEQAAEEVAVAVAQRIACGRVAHLPLEAVDQGGWHASYCIANCYADGSQSIGWHTDRLTALGPLPIIASLSLGATRIFQLQRQQRLALGRGGATGSGSGSSTSTGGGSSVTAASSNNGETQGSGGSSTECSRVERIDVPLPHNSLLIMWPPTQEAWKHKVPKTPAAYPHHPLSGGARYSLTFRRIKPAWEQQAPLCHCGRPVVMKAWQQEQGASAGQGARVLRYYYACDNAAGSSTCRFWQRGPEIQL